MSPAKQDAKGTMRLETPVIYFYSQEPREVSVRVEFPGSHRRSKKTSAAGNKAKRVWLEGAREH